MRRKMMEEYKVGSTDSESTQSQETTETTPLLFSQENTQSSLTSKNNSSSSTLDPTSFKEILRQGGRGVFFRLTQIPIPILEGVFLANVNAVKPGALAAGGLTSIMRTFILHAPGSFVHILAVGFRKEAEENSRKYYGALIVVTGIGALVFPLILFSGPILVAFGVDPTISQYVQAFFSAYKWGYFPMQWFSVNRKLFNSLCGEPQGNDENYKFWLVPIGLVELGLYATLGFGFITGGLGLPLLANAGSGYAFSVCAGWAFLSSTATLVFRESLRKHIHPKHITLEGIKNSIKEILITHAPISARFYLESISLTLMSIFTGWTTPNNLIALQICNTVTGFIEGPSFSFIAGSKPLLVDEKLDKSCKKKEASLKIISIPTGYSLAGLIAASIAAKPIAGLFLSSQTAEDRKTIQDITQKALPFMVSTEVISTLVHGQRAILQTVGQRCDDIRNSRILPKENWIVTAHTAALPTAVFLPLAYLIGVKLDYGLPGMAGIYFLCMVALLLSLLPRTIYALNHPTEPPRISSGQCWASFHKESTRKNAVIAHVSDNKKAFSENPFISDSSADHEETPLISKSKSSPQSKRCTLM
jgi:Na+-driven multidrug efflux pump